MQDMIKEDNFSNIIGYEPIKKSLNRILDIIKCKEKYKELGVHIPHGLLISGEPGIGKTSLANDFVKATNRKSYLIRKTKSNGSFIDSINDTFNEAKQNTPSIIFLDDLDKFSDTDKMNTNAEEYIVLQSLIDSVVEEDIFIIATANDLDSLPYSLLRAGRFDNQFSLKVPTKEETEQIIEYYLKNKKVSNNVCASDIAKILSNKSCAVLEKVVNEAGIIAGYQNHKEITQDDMINASLSVMYNVSLDNKVDNSKYLLETAYHEAGHALVAELLEPSSISFISAVDYDANIKGFTLYNENKNYSRDFIYQENRVKTLLAGKAATELIFSKVDVGTNSDLNSAYSICKRMVDDYAIHGFDTHIFNHDPSNEIQFNIENKINTMINIYYREVMTILRKNRKLLDKIANELATRGILFSHDIAEIKESVRKDQE